ncbi:unnamed protein product [Rhizoctonia solani]|uniref:Uncharacterized protein n=1 Tax=Rhizoctonia solani TaxID=456999 RepID=A0A8H3CW56_9AGAM|nr:unnamed protein product [Rhizoctonia solani]
MGKPKPPPYDSRSASGLSYLPTPVSSVCSLPPSTSSSPLYAANSSFAGPSPCSDTSNSSNNTGNSVSPSHQFAPMTSKPPLPTPVVSACLQQPTPPRLRQPETSTPPPPVPMDHNKLKSKICTTCLAWFTKEEYLAIHRRYVLQQTN